MWWIQPLLKRGYASPLDETCVWDLPTSDQARPLQEKFDKFYNGQHELDRAKRPNVNNAIWESVKPTWGIAFVLHLAGAGLMLFQPFVIKAILKSIKGEDNSLGISSGYTLAVLLGCAAFCGATAVSAGQFLTTRVACNARMIVINSAFRKILRLSATARRTMDTGEIVTFVGVDSDRVSAAYKLGMWCIVAPLMLVAVCILIGTQMGTIVAVVASISMVLLVLGSLAMSKKIGDHRRQISRISANRLKVTNEMLQGIRVVRFYGWEGFVNELIHEIREKEIALLRKYNHLRLANTVLMFLAPTLLNLACFAATILLGGSLDVATTFVILALTNACRTPFSIFADASVAVAEAVTSTSRLSDFLAAGESARSIKGEDIRGGTPIISLKDADFQWEEDASTPTLCNINLTLQPGTLTIVVGAVGSGKSSLVNAIIEEMQLVRGTRVVRGDVALQMYIDYLAASEWNGWILGVAIVILFSVTQATLFVSDWFLSRWSQGSVALSQNNSLAVYVGIVAGAALLVLGRCFFFMEICMTCSVKIHLKHLRKVIAAPITTFFDVTPIGRILNRFSRDLDEVDNPLPYWALWLLLCIFQVLSSFIVCAAVNPFVLIVYGPVGYGCWFAAKVYQSSARELKRLDGVTRSPFLNLMSETISGIETVRAYKMVDAFANRCEELLNNNSKVYFLSQTAARWFDMRADWFVSLIIGVVAVLAIATKSSVGAAVAGLSLTYASQLSSSFQRMTTLSTRVESSMTCFERIAHYGSLPEEGYKREARNKDSLTADWPRTGAVVFENVSMRYRDDLPLVLKNVSFSVNSGEKVGICGRTGSGKSSLMSVLFRVVEIPNSGRVLIDGVDIATITVHQLRTKLTIIPQDPMLFSGSLRMNLDPFAEKSDAELYEVLRKVHLSETVSGWGKGLDYEVAEKGENLSVGQRQLLCIARALIRDSKVIVMDEATANVDQESDKLIQQTMKESFGGGDRTVLCIAHRINTIMDSDKILILDAGEVVEYDTPSALLQVKGGVFKSLVSSSKKVLP
ncbi:multidrug resistance protein ABC superfamily [Phytophthora cinnamomi]|uniref:multidrug resistance protein ABC superfamily n=1 Tax=Phytophthora cinnamomi TaxID=4785 RepID=UPI00355A2707|nr:multidrug resistance protein ABC superfamily [Phytophthora cinnamomi]